MKNFTNLLLGLALIISLILISGCRQENKESLPPDTPDENGNLVLTNHSGKKLVIYKGNLPIRTIPDDSSDFLIHIDNPTGGKVDLRLFKAEAVKDNIDKPDSAQVFKRWIVILSKDKKLINRKTWAILANDTQSNVGTVSFSYIGGTEKSVDVYANEKNGARLISLSPGDQYRDVGLDYGNYVILFRYWESDQQTTTGEKEEGWIDKEIVNGEEVSIYIVLNEQRKKRAVQVPHWNGGDAVQAEYGNIAIHNKTSKPIQVWAGQELIENYIWTDGSKQNSASIAANESQTFTVLVGKYTLIAKDPVTSKEISRKDVVFTPDSQTTWEVIKSQ